MQATVLLFVITLFSGPVDVLVLRSGHLLPVHEPVTLENGNVTFRHRSGVLYSLPLGEIDVVATERLLRGESVDDDSPASPSTDQSVLKIRVSPQEKERLLRELEKSRGIPRPRTSEPAIVIPDEEIEVRDRSDEMLWRAKARRLEENVKQRREELDLLTDRVRRMEDQIRSFIAIGLPSDQWGGNMRQFADAQAMLEGAELAVRRAERELSDFREMARRQGILPGWLRP